MLQAPLSMTRAESKMVTMKALGDLVRRGREARGWRGMDLAAAIGRDPSYVSRLERGTLKEIPDPETLARIAQALGTTDARLLRAIGYRLAEDAPPLPVGPDRNDLIELIVSGLTEAEARVLMVTARAIVRERDAKTVSDAAFYARTGFSPQTSPAGQPVPTT